MRAVVYHGPGHKSWEEVPKPTITDDTDAIVRVGTTTICGTDLHILKGDVPTVTDGRILGHEGVGVVTELGGAVSGLRNPLLRLSSNAARPMPSIRSTGSSTLPSLLLILWPWASRTRPWM